MAIEIEVTDEDLMELIDSGAITIPADGAVIASDPAVTVRHVGSLKLA